jgi:EmrB/QacA subfamily drug resistance transporter
VRKLEYKWVALAVTSLGVLMSAIDATIVVLAVPTMMVDLHASLVEMIWVIMGYTLTTTSLLLGLGRLADMFGRVRMYNVGFAIFTAGSLLCGMAGSGRELILFRLVQGAGGACLMANSAAILTEAFPPHERGRGLGYNATVWAVGGIVGPVLGGLVLARFSWRLLFLINVPIGVLGTLAAYRWLHEVGVHRAEEPFDLAGTLLFTSALTALLLALTRGVSQGFLSPEILGLLACSALGFAGFWAAERRAPVPVLDPALFASRVYAVAVVVGMLQSLAMFALNFLMLYFLQAVQGKAPLTAALLALPMPVLSSASSVWSGRLSDRIGHRVPATLGLLCQTAAMVLLLRLTPHSGYPVVAAGLALAGLGGGLFWSPNMSAAMGAAPAHRLGVAAGAASTLRQAGMVTSFALAIFVAARSLPPQAIQALFLGSAVNLGAPQMSAFVLGMRSAFLLSAGITLLAALLSALRPNPRAPSVREAVG